MNLPCPQLKPFYIARVRESLVTFYQGDVIRVLRSLPPVPLFQMGVTSPPYYKLFDYRQEGQYGLEATVWDYLYCQTLVFNEVRSRMVVGGTQYIVLGDTVNNYSPVCSLNQRKGKRQGAGDWHSRRKLEPGFEEKEPLRVPTKLVDYLRKSGWRDREDLIWDKGSSSNVPNSDAAAKCHESILHMVRWDKKRRFYGNTKPSFKSVLRHSPDFDPEHGCVFPQGLSDDLVGSLVPGQGKPVILDCYMGRGTTGWSAIQNGYDFVGIDLDCFLAIKRLREKFGTEVKEEVHVEI